MNDRRDIGIAGLAVMGENLALNLANKGFAVSVYNRTTSKVDAFLTHRAKNATISGFHGVKEFVGSLKRPRKILMMLKAGAVVDSFIDQLLPFLEPDDIIIDGGNSNFHDSQRRCISLEKKGLLFVGTGISGGEEGALKGPSIMPGGSFSAWQHLEPILVPISARLTDGSHCCSWIGGDGAGHFVKMVHNGIEYGDMQLICETYQLMKDVLQMHPDEMHTVFARWNENDLNSYLIEITANIFGYKDDDSLPLIDKILDTAGQKGTGKWTAIAALDAGIPLSLISEAVFARSLSAQKDKRVTASTQLTGPNAFFSGDKATLVDHLEQALYMAKIIAYTQGFNLFHSAAAQYGWQLDYGEIARIWRGGCIIRSAFLEKITAAYGDTPGLNNLLLAPYFSTRTAQTQHSLRTVLTLAVEHGIPTPSLSSALAYYDGFRTARLPANLLQAQRDYFGAHTYERLDKKRGDFFHTNWTGTGGKTTSTPYSR